MEEYVREFLKSFHHLQRKLYRSVLVDGTTRVHWCRICHANTSKDRVEHHKTCDLGRMEAIRRQLRDAHPDLFPKRRDEVEANGYAPPVIL